MQIFPQNANIFGMKVVVLKNTIFFGMKMFVPWVVMHLKRVHK